MRKMEGESDEQNNVSSHNLEPAPQQASSSTSKENLFVISRCNRNSNTEDTNGDQSKTNQETSDETSTEEKVITVFWKSGKFGASYYNLQTAELFMLDEIVDRPPEHQMLANLFRQVQPVHLVVDGKLQGTFVQCVRKLAFAGETPSSSYEPPCKITYLSSKEYGFETCKRRIFSLSLPNEPESCTEEERVVYLRTLVNFAHTQSVHALGALLKFLDMNWASINMDATSRPQFLRLRRISLADIVTIDDESYKGLQIFKAISHPSNFKKGVTGSNKEGFSVFKLFNKCSSKMGSKLLRVMMQHPTRSISEIKRRQDVIEFFQNPQNDGTLRSICLSLRYMKNVSGVMAKIKALSAKPYDWKSLYNTLYNAVLVCEICENCSGSEFLNELAACDNNKLYEMALHMNRIIDFELSKAQGKFTVKPGVDHELDKKKQVMASLHGLMSTTARCELEKLPPFIEECTMVYIPHLGYLLGVKAWAPDLTPTQKELPDMKFMFQNHDYIHYKSKGCEELDLMIGDTYPEIMAHETRIMMRLTKVIMENLETLSTVISKCSELDCLIAISKVCREYSFVRPTISTEKIIKIKQGKHPLHMIRTDNFIPNDTLSTKEAGYVKILTGPNSSGKSVYLKQVALITYLAHIGSFVPAESAEIGIVSHIYTRIQSLECIGSHMSAFLIDLRQMALALQESTSNSLVVVDEFGKGTSEVDGLALLAACLNCLLFEGERCPHVLLSTHFLNIASFMIDTPLVHFQRLEHMVRDGELVFLFKLADGRAESSYAHQVSKMTRIEGHVVDRARQVMECMMKNELPPINKHIAAKQEMCIEWMKNELYQTTL